ncbi:hypothetical protein HY404_03255 [Candidatus Microgenomates bacterium]|nr:hypothetical protein [Candidatus Microgenomates bacterium]
MAESERNITPEMIVIDQETCEVLAGLTDTEGQLIAQNLIYRLLFDTQIDTFFLMGPPLAGKSTLLEQITSTLEQNAQILQVPLAINKILYEKELADARSKGIIPDSPEFNIFFLEKINHPSEAIVIYPGYNIKAIHLIESPSVGDKFPKDRGVTAFEYIAANMNNTLFIYLINHAYHQSKGLAMREEIPQLSDEAVIRTMREKFKEIVDLDDSKEAGAKIKEWFINMATLEETAVIKREARNQVHAFRERVGAEKFYQKAEKIKLPENYNPERMAEMSYDLSREIFDQSSERDIIRKSLAMEALGSNINARDEATFAQFTFEDLGVPADRYIVSFMPILDKPIHRRLIL